MNFIKLLINSNIYISLAAVALTVSTQIQIGIKPQWHPYLFLIFFATLFEYNLHRLITILTHSEAINSEKHSWVKKNSTWFYLLVTCSVIGFVIAVLEAKITVLLALAPIAGLTLFYSTPITKTANGIFRLRQIPYLKIFLISFVWSALTILLPVIHSENRIDDWRIVTMIIERFLFVLAITIPFDIRDMEDDSLTNLKTIPLKIGVANSSKLSIVLITLFLIVTIVHYTFTSQSFLIIAYLISFLTTLYFLSSKKIKNSRFYYYGILDGTMLLQGILVILFYLIYKN